MTKRTKAMRIEPLKSGSQRRLLKAARRYARMRCFGVEVNENGAPEINGVAYGHIVRIPGVDRERIAEHLKENLAEAAVEYLLAMTVTEVKKGLIE